MGRRRFLTVTAAAAALAFGTSLPARGAAGSRELDAARIGSDPFTLGVAAGDPSGTRRSGSPASRARPGGPFLSSVARNERETDII
ncbi:hypothetical protein AQI94_03965 [Streptomyces pseudovenezuelae]|uniref:Uncharacterized protein n=1 Tax=Streptomyces pseudovenezuelae TaxID=67350 RepID=A0A101ND82_9ACTN|nr:hypothetical protein AQI94_03965 [Streptomyces pseudovenezuelae]